VSERYDVIGIGNAIVDVLSMVGEEFLTANGVQKGVMQLIDADRAIALYGAMGQAREISGGSAANTIAGLAMLGGKAAFVGKVKDDQLGAIFAHDIRALGAEFSTPMAPKALNGEETARCMVLVTPDGERSMNTYLGVSGHLGPDDIDADAHAAADWTYLEGYCLESPDTRAAFAKAIKAAKGAGRKVAVSLSDPFCVDRNRDEFRRLVREDADLLFANEHEVESLYQTGSLETALEAARADIAMSAITTGPTGAWILTAETRQHVPAAPMERVDATGAGDLFAAGFLYGLTQGHDLTTAGTMGCLAAGEIITHIGARPEQDLKTLFKKTGLMS